MRDWLAQDSCEGSNTSRDNSMNVYIKSFNRPFYLDRCIRSVMFNVKGIDRIIVLDDGTLSKYKQKLMKLYPDIEIRSSGADDMKMAYLREERFNDIQRHYPIASNFWVAELSLESDDYFFLLEDDSWVCQRLDLPLIRRALQENNGVIYKCWWGNSKHNIYRSLRSSSGNSVDFFRFHNEKLTDAYSAWIVAFAVFRKDYWLNNFSGINRMADEYTQLINAQNFILKYPQVKFMKSARRSVYQGWVVPGRSTPEYYDMGLRQHLFMDVLNEAWINGKLNVEEGYPFDFSDDYILSIFKQSLASKFIDAWRAWKTTKVQYFY
jgi:hypothetical protein